MKWGRIIMAYRTKTYIAADWDGDKNAIDQLHTWNDGKHYWDYESVKTAMGQ